MSTDSAAYGAGVRRAGSRRSLPRPLVAMRGRPELVGLMLVAGVLNLWGLSVNGWANTYYAAAVKSMSTSWHDFLFISLDRTGLMTVDKPPLALWVQALSARVFGLDSLSILIPQALMGIAATALVYDLVRRRFGRVAGFAAGFALATTPVVVAVSRHNNPDELLTLCCVAALWFTVRALETGRTTWLVWAGVAVGLGFETKMGVALMVVPGIAAAYLYAAPRGHLTAIRQLLAGGIALTVVGLAWPILVTLTPAADRPWISGTSDNSIWSLIFSYNGVGRIAGQTGGPGGAIGGGRGPGGGLFGGSTGVFRLLQSSLGDQAGWLLGFALVSGAGILVATRLRRRDPRTGWVIAVGGALVTTAAVFSFASGIFHPYYVAFLAPFTAALVGAGVGVGLSGTLTGRMTAGLAIVAGAITELVVLGTLHGSLSWGRPLAIAGAVVGVIAVALTPSPRVRIGLLAVALAALFATPAVWATETLGHATSGTFPAGGAASADGFGGPGGPGPRPVRGGLRAGGSGAPGGFPLGGVGGFAPPGGVAPAGVGRFAPGVPGPGGRRGDSTSLAAAIRYARSHGGGTIGVESQSSAAEAILTQNADVAGLGGFSGRESAVSVSWLAGEVRAGRLRWVIASAGQGFGGLAGDTRKGSQAALGVVATVCRAVSLPSASGAAATLGFAAGTGAGAVKARSGSVDVTTMYDCRGDAGAILAAAQ